MQNNIQNSNYLSFKGAFLLNFNRTLPNTREYFENSMRGKIKGQIFEDFKGKQGDILYVLRDTKDFHAANFIIRNKLKFKYFPEMSSKLQFDTYEPQTVIDYIKKEKPRKITKIDELKNFIYNESNRVRIQAVKDSHLYDTKLKPSKKEPAEDNLCNEILKFFEINLKGKHRTLKNGVTRIEDGNGYINLSPMNSKGRRFAIIKPNNLFDEITYARIRKDNTIEKYNSNVIDFYKEYRNAIEEAAANIHNT